MDKRKAVRKEKEGAFVDLLNQEMKELQDGLKQKQIEEIARDICGNFGVKIENLCGLLAFKCDCKCKWFDIAERFYNAGYHKIPEGGVVLTEEAYSDLLSDEVDTIERDIAEYWATQDAKSVAKELHKDGYRKLDDHAIFVLRKAKGLEEKIRNETAKKFAERLKHELDEWLKDNEDLNGKIDFGIALIELIGVESLEGEIIVESLIDEICKEISEGKV